MLVFAVAELSGEQGTAANRQITKLARGAMALWVKSNAYLGVSNHASPSQVLQLRARRASENEPGRVHAASAGGAAEALAGGGGVAVQPQH